MDCGVSQVVAEVGEAKPDGVAVVVGAHLEAVVPEPGAQVLPRPLLGAAKAGPGVHGVAQDAGHARHLEL